MADDATDIRQWAKDHGIEVGARGRVPKEIEALFREEQASGDVVPIPDVAPPSPNGETAPVLPGEAVKTDETPPKAPPKRKWWQPKTPATGQPAKRSREPKTHGRVPLESWAGLVCKVAAYLTGAGTTPTSRCLNMQAPVVGVIADDAIKGTVVDEWLQPIARLGEGGKTIAATVGLPALVFLTERQPQLYPFTRPLMAEAATEWVLIAGPAMRKAKKRAELVAKELAEFELNEDDIAGAFTSAAANPVIEKMLDAIFAPMMGAVPEPEAAA